MGSGVIALGLFGGAMLFESKKNKAAIGQTAGGSWDAPFEQPTGSTTVHAALLDGGRVLWIAGSAAQNQFTSGPFKHGIWNPDGTFSETAVMDEDLFCCGMATLANGNILLCGGTLLRDGPTGAPKTSVNGKYAGGQYAYEADFASGLIGRRSEMRHGRWYPTCVSLPDGKVCVIEGFDEYGVSNRLVEFYDPVDQSWTIRLDPAGTNTWCAGQGQQAYDFSPMPPAGSQCYGPGTTPHLILYPRMHLMPSGLIASAGMGATDRVYDPSSYKWLFSKFGVLKRHYGTSVLCPLENTPEEKGKILLAGGSPEAIDISTNVCEIAEPSGTSGITRRTIAPMTYARKQVSPVLLPTGEIVIFGGNLQYNASGPQLIPEVFDPITETWQTWEAATVPRGYHQVALLLPDGRVWTAGTTASHLSFESRVEIFNPWYISEIRPTIFAEPTVGTYGSTITIPTPDALTITKVSLVKQSSMTHHYNTDQRLIWLQILSRTDSTVTVKAPINSKLAPPGMYLIHVLNDAAKPVPSIGKFIKILGDPTADVTYVSIYSVAGSNNYSKLYTGNFKRAGELMHKTSTINSALIGKSVKKVKVILKKSGNPTGTIKVVVRNSAGSIVHSFGTINATALKVSDQSFEREAAGSRTLSPNDRILVEWDGTGSSTDQVWVKRTASDSAGGFDGPNTKATHFKTAYSNLDTFDLAGEWFGLA